MDTRLDTSHTNVCIVTMSDFSKSRIDRKLTGAGDGIRTRDQELGKLLLYQLSYARLRHLTRSLPNRYVKWKPRIDAEGVYHGGPNV